MAPLHQMEDHMECEGISSPEIPLHGSGRRYIEAEDHQVTRQDFECGADGSPGRGRKHIIPIDHFHADLMPLRAEGKTDLSAQVKEAIKEWMVATLDMIVFDERRWQRDVVVQPRGVHWVIESVTERMQCIAREGPNAKAIAERLSMMQISELRYFGVRFRAKTDPKPPPLHRQKGSVLAENPSLTSEGVSCTVSRSNDRSAQPMKSSSRKTPEDTARRFIASGKDHFNSGQVNDGDAPGSHGHTKDDDFSDGIARGIGHGRRYVGAKDHLRGPCTVAEDPKSRGYEDDFGRGEIGHGRRYIGTTDHLFR